MNVIIFGPPGAGKGTQANNIVKKFNLYQVSTGDLLRKEVKNQTEIGKDIENIISNILDSIDNIKAIYLVGDYAKGIDSGIIKIFVEGKFKDKKYISEVLNKTEKKINRKIVLVNNIDPFEEKLLY